MLSILIPTYNYPIFPLVEGIHRQCLELGVSFEISVIEDSSTKVFEANQKITNLPKTNYQVLSTNVGRTKVRQLLAENATYDWLLFLDADVLPVKKDFIKRYLKEISENIQLIFGGVTYLKEKPKKENLLRWVYGSKRETKSVSERNKNPYYIISQNILIKKSIFLKVNKHLENKYGMDNVFSFQLKKHAINIKHIENPVFHNGLEQSSSFLKKSLNAVETLLEQENKNNISLNFTSLQKFYLKLKKFKVHLLVYRLINPFIKKIESNLSGSNPKIYLLDLYKLHYFIKLKHGK